MTSQLHGDSGTAATGQRTTGAASGTTARQPEPLYGGHGARRVTVRDLAAAKARGEKWPMLTAYDALTARVFDDAGIPVLLVGDSASMVVYGHDTHDPGHRRRPAPADRRGGARHRRAMVVADLPFGSYQASPEAGAGRGDPVPEGGRRAGGQARGRRTGCCRRPRNWWRPASR